MLHEEDASELLYNHTNWQDRVTVGPGLEHLHGLQRLEVDFRGEGGDMVSVPACTPAAKP